jgi:hypothetical protein
MPRNSDSLDDMGLDLQDLYDDRESVVAQVRNLGWEERTTAPAHAGGAIPPTRTAEAEPPTQGHRPQGREFPLARFSSTQDYLFRAGIA